MRHDRSRGFVRIAAACALTCLLAAHTAAAQAERLRGITYTVDTTTDGAITSGIIDPLVLRVTYAGGRGRIDVLARIARPAVRLKWLTLALNPALPGDYYLFDSARVLHVRPASRTFTTYALANVSYNYEGARDRWPFFRFDPDKPDTLATSARPTEGTSGDFSLFWHAELMRDTSCTGADFGKCIVRELARGRADVRAAPAEQGGVLRWMVPTRALASIAGLDSLLGQPIRLTAINYWKAPSGDGVAFLGEARFFTGLRKIDVDPATLTLPGGYTEARQRTDTSPHRVRFVPVDSTVQLEVLDWGGSGRPVVLLAGLGGTAHDFDEFAPKLAASYHVYAVTRRGFGQSSVPAFGYGADRLGDDVLAVIDSLRLRRPIVAGHSLAGEELSSIGSRHADRVAGLIYLEAGYDYAFYDTSHGNFSIDVNEIVRALDKLRFGSGASTQDRRQAMLVLADTSLPAFLKALKGILREPAFANDPVSRPMDRVPYAVVSGERKYTAIRGPVLAIFASSSEARPGMANDPAMRAMIAEADSAVELQVAAFARGVPQARVVRIPHANHFVFRSNEAEVLREMRSFIDSLPRTPN